MLFSTHDSTELRTALNKAIDFKELTIHDTITSLFMTSWDLNNRTPRFFSKWAYDELNESDSYNHTMNLEDMVMATAATPFYFTPAKI